MGCPEFGLFSSIERESRMTGRRTRKVSTTPGPIFEEPRIRYEPMTVDREFEGQCITMGMAGLVFG
jgi:hypothetical protein